MRSILFYFLLATITISCSTEKQNSSESGLKDAFKNNFYIGTALSTGQYFEQDERALKIVKAHFNSITPENDMKWENIHPKKGEYNFEKADKFVEFGEKHGMFIIGHTLVWHSQTPAWVFEDDEGNLVDKDELLARMKDHINEVVGRYKGRIHGWDVVNEAVDDNGSLRESLWYKIIGEDFLAKAFQFAHEADPDAELYYNDFNLHQPHKADAVVDLVKNIQAQGIEVTGIGMQGHYGLDYPTEEELDNSINKFKKLGLVAITELDMDVLPSASSYTGADLSRTEESRKELDPYSESLPDSIAQKQTQQFEMLFKVYLRHSDSINRVTVWGVTDGDSWKNGWPIPGRTNYPLLFDRDGQPKPAVHAIKKLANETN